MNEEGELGVIPGNGAFLNVKRCGKGFFATEKLQARHILRFWGIPSHFHGKFENFNGV